jgi:DNA anti-recombination protein RmuC
MMGVVQEFVGLTSRIEAHQANTHGDLEGVVRVMAESNQNLTRALEDLHGKHEDVLQAIERNARQAHSETKDARELAQQGIGELAELLRSSVDNQVGTLRAQALELFEQQQVGTRSHLEQLLERQGQFVTQLQESVGRSDGHQALLSGLAATISGEREDFASRLQQVLGQNERALGALLTEQKQLLDISGMRRVEEGLEQFVRENRTEFAALVHRQAELDQHLGELGRAAGQLGATLRVLIGVAAVTVPVFAALGIMYIFDLRPADMAMRAVSLLVIALMIFMLAWFLRAKT